MSTPELKPEEKTVFFGFQNILVEVAIFPKDDAEADLVTVKKPMDGKSPSQRLHSVLFLLWKQEGEEGQFEQWYQGRMENIINEIKQQLPAQ